MTTMEIVLLLLGGAAFLVSFILPGGRKEQNGKTEAFARQEIRSLLTREMDQIKGHVEDVVEESMQYTMEKTERALERLSNEKIMAVNEYSDTVLEEINKNHKEVMFLYDMLNDKHHTLVTMMTDLDKAAKEAQESAREVRQETEAICALHASGTIVQAAAPGDFHLLQPEGIAIKEEMVSESSQKPEENQEPGHNNNDRILELFKAGKSKVEIAKELGLGIGEVKLVLDLYKGI